MKKIFYLDIQNIDNELEGITAISLVERAAVDVDFLKFNADTPQPNKFEFDEEKHIIKGVAIRADYPIYRFSEEIGDYYVVFTKDVIQKLIQKFFKDDLIKKVNLQHDSSQYVDNIYITESYTIDRKNGLNPIEFQSIEDGSWIISMKVENDEVWKSIKQNDKLNGFSIEGYFYELSSHKKETKNEVTISFDNWIDSLIKNK